MKGSGRRTVSAEPFSSPERQLSEWDWGGMTSLGTVIDRHEAATERAPRDRQPPRRRRAFTAQGKP